jgi:hypothetical protein
MANITPVVTHARKNVEKVTWTGITADVCLPYRLLGQHPDSITVQVIGGAATMLGSLEFDGADSSAVGNHAGAAISLADLEIESILERPQTLNPVITSATPATVTMLVWRG